MIETKKLVSPATNHRPVMVKLRQDFANVRYTTVDFGGGDISFAQIIPNKRLTQLSEVNLVIFKQVTRI